MPQQRIETRLAMRIERQQAALQISNRGGIPNAVARYRQFAEDGDIEAQYNLTLIN